MQCATQVAGRQLKENQCNPPPHVLNTCRPLPGLPQFLGAVLGGAIFQQACYARCGLHAAPAVVCAQHPLWSACSARCGLRACCDGCSRASRGGGVSARSVHCCNRAIQATSSVPRYPCLAQIGSMIETPGYWLQMLGTSLPSASTYFLNYCLVGALSSNFSRFIWVSGLHFDRACLGSSCLGVLAWAVGAWAAVAWAAVAWAAVAWAAAAWASRCVAVIACRKFPGGWCLEACGIHF